MKKSIVLAALLLTASLTVTSCWNTNSEPAPAEPTEKPADSLTTTKPADVPADAAQQIKGDSATVAPQQAQVEE